MKKLILFLFTISTFSLFSQAKLEIKNNSGRYITVKIMKGYGSGSLYKTVNVSAYDTRVVYFSYTDDYYTKTKASLLGKDPVYEKGEPFRVVNDDTGYSVITLEFSITESNIANVIGGKRISKAEFDQD